MLYAAGGDIGDTLQRVDHLRRIHAIVIDQLPGDLRAQVHTAGLNQGRLRLHVANAALATRIRYMQPAFARALARERRLQVDSLEIKIRPDAFAPAAPPSRPRELSPRTTDQIESIADGVTHAPLADALKQLAQAGRSSDQY